MPQTRPVAERIIPEHVFRAEHITLSRWHAAPQCLPTATHDIAHTSPSGTSGPDWPALVKTCSSVIELVVALPSIDRSMRDPWITTSFPTPPRKVNLLVFTASLLVLMKTSRRNSRFPNGTVSQIRGTCRCPTLHILETVRTPKRSTRASSPDHNDLMAHGLLLFQISGRTA